MGAERSTTDGALRTDDGRSRLPRSGENNGILLKSHEPLRGVSWTKDFVVTSCSWSLA
jgi:hypothetical protein